MHTHKIGHENYAKQGLCAVLLHYTLIATSNAAVAVMDDKVGFTIGTELMMIEASTDLQIFYATLCQRNAMYDILYRKIYVWRRTSCVYSESMCV